MFQNIVAPILKELAPAGRSSRAAGGWLSALGESKVESIVGEAFLAIPGLELGYCARPGAVEVRCIGGPEALAAAEAIMAAKLPTQIAGEGGESLEELVVHRLAALGKTLATAESCTGGYLAHKITNVPGASEVFVEGFVTYSNEAKTRALGVPADLIAEHGAVSEPVARAMAEGAMRVRGCGLWAGDHRHRRSRRRHAGETCRDGLHRARHSRWRDAGREAFLSHGQGDV
jgi:nicotinamide-nucleotide amidase